MGKISRVLLAAAIGVSVSAGAALAGDTMTGAELTALLANGKTIKLGGPGTEYNGELAMNADGTGKGQVKTNGGRVIKVEGTWKINGDQVCRIWEDLDDGKEVCETWEKDGTNRVQVMVDGESVGVNYW
jgi:hypothetical protein